jgi:hypothetical protein
MNLMKLVSSDQPGPSHVPKLDHWLQQGRGVTLHLVQFGHCYCPETIAVMTAAFDRVSQSITEQMSGNDDVKKTLALIILRHVDRGERDPERLAQTAFREWTGTDRSAIGDRWAATG